MNQIENLMKKQPSQKLEIKKIVQNPDAANQFQIYKRGQSLVVQENWKLTQKNEDSQMQKLANISKIGSSP